MFQLAGVVLLLALLLPSATGMAAQSASDGISPDECTTEPLTRAEIEAEAAASGTPVPGVFVDTAGDLPQGEAASDEDLARVVALELEFAACWNGANYPAMLALMTPGARRVVLADLVSEDSLDLFLDTTGTPETFGDDVGPDVIRAVRVSGVRLLQDGRIGAIVEWDMSRSLEDWGEVNFHVYEEIDGRLLLDEEISGFVYDGPAGIPAN
jgi:hypothetical protein